MFAIESLALAGETYENSASVRLACEFLISKQMEDGGWGESYKVSPLSHFLSSAVLIFFPSANSHARVRSMFIISNHKSSTPRGLF